MEFRPCIDIHDGKVKQIVGGSLSDSNGASENFVSEQDGAFYASFYKSRGIKGGHVIMLNKKGTPEYELTKAQALSAIKEYPKGLQVGGGIDPGTAGEFIENGASHVIVTSYVFNGGKVDYDRLKEMTETAGRENLVLDLSCRKKDDKYYVVTDRWQKFTDVVLDEKMLEAFEKNAAEYLIHAVDVEGKASGVDSSLIKMLGGYDGIPVTYAGGVHTYEDLDIIKNLGQNRVNVTIGSALDLFGGNLKFDEVLKYCK